MTLIKLSQHDQSIHNVNSVAFNTSVDKAINSKFNNSNSVIRHKRPIPTLYSNRAQKTKRLCGTKVWFSFKRIKQYKFKFTERIKFKHRAAYNTPQQ